MGEPCCFCASTDTGVESGTPIGICVDCACPTCRGFRRFDDRGFVVVNQPFLSATDCGECGGKGTRVADAPDAPRVVGPYTLAEKKVK